MEVLYYGIIIYNIIYNGIIIYINIA